MKLQPAGALGEPVARKISPALFFLVIICFLLPFASVSCNTDTVKAKMGPRLSSLGGSSSDTASLNHCLDAYKSTSLITYSGINLLVGSDPKVNDTPPACKETGTASSTPPTSKPSEVNVGMQPLALLAFIAILVGLAFGAFKLPLRSIVVAVLAACGGALLFAEQGHLTSAIPDKLMASGGGSGSLPGFSITDFIQVSAGTGYLLALGLLAIAIIYNLAVFGIGRLAVVPATPATPSDSAPPAFGLPGFAPSQLAAPAPRLQTPPPPSPPSAPPS